jgi:hypothetical protein
MVQTSFYSSLSVPLGDLDHLKILQRSLVITCMDKCCNNFVFVCKTFYGFYILSKLNFPIGTYVVSNLAQCNILKFHLSFNKVHSFKGVKCGPCLSFLCVVWKFHKNPIKPRFICASNFTLWLMFLSGYVLFSKLCFLQSDAPPSSLCDPKGSKELDLRNWLETWCRSHLPALEGVEGSCWKLQD